MNIPFPSFKTPPLSEVSIGIQFEPLDRLRIPHFGIFWEGIRKDFPLVEHAPPLATPEKDFFVDPSSGLVLPRIWFINKSETRLIQLQANRYNFNWRVRDNAEPYPRYPEIESKFFQHLDTLENFVAAHEIGIVQPSVAELTYVNILEQGKEWNSVEDIANVIRDFSWNKQNHQFLDSPKELNWSVSFQMPNDQGVLNARLRHAKKVKDEHPVLQLEMTATCKVTGWSRESIRAWYELAHEWIVKGFVDLTKPEVQEKFWGLEK